jgi:DNA-binding MarR family transcriptional regulator
MSARRAHNIGAVKGVTQAKAIQLWQGLARAHSSMTVALERDMMPEAGMPLAWYEVLHSLSSAEGGMLRYQELARVAGITNSGASRRLDQMTKAGLIERRSCPTDRRGVFAHITAKGETAYSRAHAAFVRSLERNFGSQLNPHEAEVIAAALSRLS